jgi:serine/threonine protein kinase/tetratricopeptide (TPR) repeat protein
MPRKGTQRTAMGIKCSRCQSNNPETATFCADCGTKLSSLGDISITKTLETPIEGYSRGTLFAGRYEIIEELGKGGMGAVYRVEDKKIGQEIALKLINPDVSSDKSTIERFRNELKTTRMISHRNVCRMFDLGDAEGTHFITMEYVPGEDLKSLIKRVRRLDAGKAISIANQVCEGLAEAHRLGVVHRDLKSSNIMIDKEGNARIMDFGIARSQRAKGLTGEGIIIGTPEYMSPEQAEAKEVDHRSDIYSLGVILYEMVTGKLPFEGDSPLSIAMKHKGEMPKNPKELNPQIPEDLNALILKCLEKDKQSRHQSVEELYAELNNIEERLPATQKLASKRKALTSKEITVTFRLKKLLIPALVLIAVVAAAVIIWQLLPQKEVPLAPKIENSVAVISFENRTGDNAYDHLQKVIPDLLITNLENAGYFYVATWERMHDLLKQMDKGDVDIITSDLGFQACQREGIQALALGSYAKVGETFVTDIKVLDVESKRLLKSASSRGEGEESIFVQIDELSKKIAEGMGLSLQKIEAASLNTSEVTTNSIEAYKYFLKGRENYEKLYYDEASTSFEKAVILDPEFAVAYLYLARSVRGKARIEAYEKAKIYSEKATEKERLYIEAAYASAVERDPEKKFRILTQMAKEYPKEKRIHYDLANYYRDRALFDKAIEEFNIALELDPEYGLVFNELAFVYMSMENFEKAIEYFKKYVSVSPKDANPLDSMALCYFLTGRIEEAVTKFKEALEIKPDWVASYWGLSYISALKENYSEVMRWVGRAVDMAPSPVKRGEGYLLKGFFYFWLGRLEQSLKELDTVSDLAESIGYDFQKFLAGVLTGWVHYERGELELARRSWKNSFDILRPRADLKANYSLCLGAAEVKEGRIESAKSRLAEVKSLLPEIYAAYKDFYKYSHDSLQAEVMLAEGSLEEAIAICKRLWSPKLPSHDIGYIISLNVLSPGNVLARCYRQKGELDKAIAEYEQLITSYPESKSQRLIHPMYHYQLAKLYEEKGWEGKAIDQYQKFLDIWKDADPGIAEVKDARERLTELKR